MQQVADAEPVVVVVDCTADSFTVTDMFGTIAPPMEMVAPGAVTVVVVVVWTGVTAGCITTGGGISIERLAIAICQS